MDEIARHAKECWEGLAAAGSQYTRPFLSLDEASARQVVDPYGLLGDRVTGDVLCLAGGGGQQSAAFALLGARVTVLDICETQLERDRLAAAHYGRDVRTVQGDMRDLGFLTDGSLDVVWHAHSLTFIPDPRPVFDEVTRVLRRGGVYHLDCWNPFSQAVLEAAEMGVDALNPVRNNASVAHPNEVLIGEPEAMLVINTVRTLLSYLENKRRDSKS